MRSFRQFIRELLCLHVWFYDGVIPGSTRVRGRCNFCEARREIKMSDILG